MLLCSDEPNRLVNQFLYDSSQLYSKRKLGNLSPTLASSRQNPVQHAALQGLSYRKVGIQCFPLSPGETSPWNSIGRRRAHSAKGTQGQDGHPGAEGPRPPQRPPCQTRSESNGGSSSDSLAQYLGQCSKTAALLSSFPGCTSLWNTFH